MVVVVVAVVVVVVSNKESLAVFWLSSTHVSTSRSKAHLSSPRDDTLD